MCILTRTTSEMQTWNDHFWPRPGTPVHVPPGLKTKTSESPNPKSELSWSTFIFRAAVWVWNSAEVRKYSLRVKAPTRVANQF
jgi:hypothetical protein